jgi:hypothetical protein
MREIAHPVPSQPEPLSLDNRDIQNAGQRASHLYSLRLDSCFSDQELAFWVNGANEFVISVKERVGQRPRPQGASLDR